LSCEVQINIHVYYVSIQPLSAISWRPVLVVEEAGVPGEIQSTMGKQTIVKEVYNFLILVGYSQICIKRLPLGQRKDGLLKQMTS
jgi:hypothetical protein